MEFCSGRGRIHLRIGYGRILIKWLMTAGESGNLLANGPFPSPVEGLLRFRKYWVNSMRRK